MSPPSYLISTATITENLLKRKWSAVILRHFANGLSDPVEIRKREVDLSPSVMIERLRTMLRYGLVTRIPLPTQPKMIEYRLTAKGQNILKVLDLIDQINQPPANTGANSEKDAGARTRRKKADLLVEKQSNLPH